MHFGILRYLDIIYEINNIIIFITYLQMKKLELKNYIDEPQ